MQLILSAPDHATVDRSAELIADQAAERGIRFTGPIPLPHRKNEGIHVRMFKIEHAQPEQLARLQDLQLPTGLDIEFKM